MSENNGEPDPVIVFSCRNCGVIIGDSHCLVCTNAEMQIVTLSGGHKLQRRDDQLVTSKDVFDANCAFSPVHCQDCNFLLGRYYVTTSRALSELLDNYTFDVANLRTYELGTVTNGNTLPKAGSQVDPPVDQEEELLKVQHVVIDLAVRLQRVEAELAEYRGQPSSSNTAAMHPLSSHSQSYHEGNSRHIGSNDMQLAGSNGSGIKQPRG